MTATIYAYLQAKLEIFVLREPIYILLWNYGIFLHPRVRTLSAMNFTFLVTPLGIDL